MFFNMRKLLNHLILILLSFVSFVSAGQTSLDGTYERNDTLSKSHLINKMTLTIKGDSILFSRNRTQTDHSLTNNFFVYKGTIHKYTDYYFGSLILIECDTCPSFWKYTTKAEDSIGIEVLYSSDKIDTIITNGDTSYQRAEILSDKAGNVEVRRLAELLFTTTKNHDLLVNDKLYRRTNSK